MFGHSRQAARLASHTQSATIVPFYDCTNLDMTCDHKPSLIDEQRRKDQGWFSKRTDNVKQANRVFTRKMQEELVKVGNVVDSGRRGKGSNGMGVLQPRLFHRRFTVRHAASSTTCRSLSKRWGSGAGMAGVVGIDGCGVLAVCRQVPGLD